MALMGQGVLAFWTDILPEGEDDFNRWYGEQHLPERLSVPGFLRGRRYLSLRGEPKYFTLYETENPEVLSSPTYVARLDNPSDWTRRVLPMMRNVVRNAYRLVASTGGKDGQLLVALRLDPAPGREGELRNRYKVEVLNEMVRTGRVVSAALLEVERVATGVVTEERKLVGAVGVAPPFLYLCEMDEASTAEGQMWRSLRGAGAPTLDTQVVRGATENVYRLTHSLSRSSAQ